MGSELVTIVGLGSLLSETSSKRSFPDLQNFRLGHLRGFDRRFADYSFSKERALKWTKDDFVAPLAAVPNASNTVGFPVVLFEVERSLIPVMREREWLYDVRPVRVEEVNGDMTEGLLSIAMTEEQYREKFGNITLTQAAAIATHNHHNSEGNRVKYQSEEYPVLAYVQYVLSAAEALGKTKEGKSIKEIFLCTTLMPDGKTTLKEYLDKNDIVSSAVVPDSYKGRYPQVVAPKL